jgi:hypothetical protein
MKLTIDLGNVNNENLSAFSGPIGFDLPVSPGKSKIFSVPSVSLW